MALDTRLRTREATEGMRCNHTTSVLLRYSARDMVNSARKIIRIVANTTPVMEHNLSVWLSVCVSIYECICVCMKACMLVYMYVHIDV